MSSDEPILRAENLTKHFPSADGFLDRLLGSQKWVKAVDGVDIDVHEEETVGVVGESGCGKTTLGRTMLQLIEPTEGSVYYKGEDLTELSESEMRRHRKDLQYIFQNPFASLNPRFTVGDIIGEPLDIHDIAEGEAREARIYELLETVGLDPSHANRYPHEFSGGQRQRIGIARALALEPEVIICDEPVSALDVSVQAQIINLLEDLQEEFGLSYVFIAHDLSVVEHIADRIAVMYLGDVVEFGTTEEVFSEPYHPYTEALLSAIPEPDPLWEADRIVLEGDVPSPMDPPEGCKFHTRCPRIIQPEDMQMDQSAWVGIVRMWMDIRERGDRGAAEIVSVEKDPEEVDLTTMNVDESLREKYGVPEGIEDPTAEETFTTIVEALTDEDPERAHEILKAEFETPCMTETPEFKGEGSHPIACHLHHSGYPDPEDVRTGFEGDSRRSASSDD